jgi:acyl-CoA thioesterase-1
MSGLARLLLALVALVVAVAPVVAQDRVVLAFGDSLTAGYGVLPEEAYPALLEARLRREGYAYRVVNAGVTGDTTAGARRRLPWALRTKPSVVIVALGANDGLRGRPVASMRDDLASIVDGFADTGARVLLAGMRLPPNYGEPYTRAFAATFGEVARRRGVAFMPFLLTDVAGDARLNQADGIHPTADGQRVIAEHLWPYLRPLLRK